MGRRGRSKDHDDDKCFRRWSVIYAVIRIVAANLPCRWCIMIATMYHRVCMHTLSMSIRGVGFLQKRHPLLDDCDAHKHGSRRYIGHLLSPACSRPAACFESSVAGFTPAANSSRDVSSFRGLSSLRSTLPSRNFSTKESRSCRTMLKDLGSPRCHEASLGHFLAKFHGFLGF